MVVGMVKVLAAAIMAKDQPCVADGFQGFQRCLTAIMCNDGMNAVTLVKIYCGGGTFIQRLKGENIHSYNIIQWTITRHHHHHHHHLFVLGRSSLFLHHKPTSFTMPK